MWGWKINKHLNFIIYLGFVVLMITTCNQCKQKQGLEGRLEHVQDNMEKTSNALGQERAQRKVVTGSLQNLKLLVNNKDSIIAGLTTRLNRRSVAAATIHQQTQQEVIVENKPDQPPLVVMQYLPADSSVVYRIHQKDQWSEHIMAVTKNKANIVYTVYDKLNLGFDWQRQGLFKRKQLAFSVQNENPHTRIVDMHSVMVKDNRTQWWKYVLAGVAVGATGVYLTK